MYSCHVGHLVLSVGRAVLQACAVHLVAATDWRSLLHEVRELLLPVLSRVATLEPVYILVVSTVLLPSSSLLPFLPPPAHSHSPILPPFLSLPPFLPPSLPQAAASCSDSAGPALLSGVPLPHRSSSPLPRQRRDRYTRVSMGDRSALLDSLLFSTATPEHGQEAD